MNAITQRRRKTKIWRVAIGRSSSQLWAKAPPHDPVRLFSPAPSGSRRPLERCLLMHLLAFTQITAFATGIGLLGAMLSPLPALSAEDTQPTETKEQQSAPDVPREAPGREAMGNPGAPPKPCSDS